MWLLLAHGPLFSFFLYLSTSVVYPNKLNLDPDPGLCNMYGLIWIRILGYGINFEKNVKKASEEKCPSKKDLKKQ